MSNPRETAYSAAKAAVAGLTWIETTSSTDHEIIAGRNTPVGRAGRPDEIAAAAAFLASEAASYITGQLIVIDGGNSIQEYKGPPDLYY